MHTKCVGITLLYIYMHIYVYVIYIQLLGSLYDVELFHGCKYMMDIAISCVHVPQIQLYDRQVCEGMAMLWIAMYACIYVCMHVCVCVYVYVYVYVYVI